MSIDALAAAKGYAGLTGKTATPEPVGVMADAARRFAEVLDVADAATQGFAAGQVDTQSVVEAIAQAEMALQTAITVRDRIVGAYQEILRMPL